MNSALRSEIHEREVLARLRRKNEKYFWMLVDTLNLAEEMKPHCPKKLRDRVDLLNYQFDRRFDDD